MGQSDAESNSIVGKKVRLKSYESYCDYKDHEGEVAEVVEKLEKESPMFDYKIKWSDGYTSLVEYGNIIPERIINWRDEL